MLEFIQKIRVKSRFWKLAKLNGFLIIGKNRALENQSNPTIYIYSGLDWLYIYIVFPCCFQLPFLLNRQLKKPFCLKNISLNPYLQKIKNKITLNNIQVWNPCNKYFVRKTTNGRLQAQPDSNGRLQAQP